MGEAMATDPDPLGLPGHAWRDHRRLSADARRADLPGLGLTRRRVRRHGADVVLPSPQPNPEVAVADLPAGHEGPVARPARGDGDRAGVRGSRRRGLGAGPVTGAVENDSVDPRMPLGLVHRTRVRGDGYRKDCGRQQWGEGPSRPQRPAGSSPRRRPTPLCPGRPGSGCPRRRRRR